MYATVDEFKARLRFLPGDTVDDTELERALVTASSEVDHTCSRSFEPAGAAVARFYYPRWDRTLGRWVVDVDDVMTTTDMAVTTWTAADADWTTVVPVADIKFRPVNAASAGRPWTAMVLPSGTSITATGVDETDLVSVTAKYGWTTTPDQVKEATLIQAQRIFQRRDATFGIVSDPAGTEAARLFTSMDVDAVLALRGLIKYWAAR